MGTRLHPGNEAKHPGNEAKQPVKATISGLFLPDERI